VAQLEVKNIKSEADKVSPELLVSQNLSLGAAFAYIVNNPPDKFAVGINLNVRFSEDKKFVSIVVPGQKIKVFYLIHQYKNLALDSLRPYSTGFKGAAFLEVGEIENNKSNQDYLLYSALRTFSKPRAIKQALQHQSKIWFSFPGTSFAPEDIETRLEYNKRALPQLLLEVKPFIDLVQKKFEQLKIENLGASKQVRADVYVTAHSMGATPAIWAKHLLEHYPQFKVKETYLLDPFACGIGLDKLATLLSSDSSLRSKKIEQLSSKISTAVVTPTTLPRRLGVGGNPLYSAPIGEKLYCIDFPKVNISFDTESVLKSIISQKGPPVDYHKSDYIYGRLLEEKLPFPNKSRCGEETLHEGRNMLLGRSIGAGPLIVNPLIDILALESSKYQAESNQQSKTVWRDANFNRGVVGPKLLLHLAEASGTPVSLITLLKKHLEEALNSGAIEKDPKQTHIRRRLEDRFAVEIDADESSQVVFRITDHFFTDRPLMDGGEIVRTSLYRYLYLGHYIKDLFKGGRPIDIDFNSDHQSITIKAESIQSIVNFLNKELLPHHWTIPLDWYDRSVERLGRSAFTKK
jgi:hypothetical protein